jgi:hypothetical protein
MFGEEKGCPERRLSAAVSQPTATVLPLGGLSKPRRFRVLGVFHNGGAPITTGGIKVTYRFVYR